MSGVSQREREKYIRKTERDMERVQGFEDNPVDPTQRASAHCLELCVRVVLCLSLEHVLDEFLNQKERTRR